MKQARKRAAVTLTALIGAATFAAVWSACWYAGRWITRARTAMEYVELFPDQVGELRAEAARLQAQRDALRLEVSLLERQRADWQTTNPQRPDRAYKDTSGDPGHLDGWPSCEEGGLIREIPRHPLLWPNTKEAQERWNLWKRDHPDQAKKSLAHEDPGELKKAREELKAALAEIEAALNNNQRPER